MESICLNLSPVVIACLSSLDSESGWNQHDPLTAQFLTNGIASNCNFCPTPNSELPIIHPQLKKAPFNGSKTSR